MQVFIQTKKDWIDFCNGRTVKAKITATTEFYKSILVAFNEVDSIDGEYISIEKRY